MATEDMENTEIIDLNLEPETRMEQILNGETLEPEDRTEYFVQKALGRFGPTPPAPTPGGNELFIDAEVTAWKDDGESDWPTAFKLNTQVHKDDLVGKVVTIRLRDDWWGNNTTRYCTMTESRGDDGVVLFNVFYDPNLSFWLVCEFINDVLVAGSINPFKTALWDVVEIQSIDADTATMKQKWSEILTLRDNTIRYIVDQNGDLCAIVSIMRVANYRMAISAVGIDGSTGLPYIVRLSQIPGNTDSNQAHIEYIYLQTVQTP